MIDIMSEMDNLTSEENENNITVQIALSNEAEADFIEIKNKLGIIEAIIIEENSPTLGKTHAKNTAKANKQYISICTEFSTKHRAYLQKKGRVEGLRLRLQTLEKLLSAEQSLAKLK